MKRIVKRTTTTEEWIDPRNEDQDPRDAAEDEDESEDADNEESEDEPKVSRRRR